MELPGPLVGTRRRRDRSRANSLRTHADRLYESSRRANVPQIRRQRGERVPAKLTPVAFCGCGRHRPALVLDRNEPGLRSRTSTTDSEKRGRG